MSRRIVNVMSHHHKWVRDNKNYSTQQETSHRLSWKRPVETTCSVIQEETSPTNSDIQKDQKEPTLYRKVGNYKLVAATTTSTTTATNPKETARADAAAADAANGRMIRVGSNKLVAALPLPPRHPNHGGKMTWNNDAKRTENTNRTKTKTTVQKPTKKRKYTPKTTCSSRRERKSKAKRIPLEKGTFDKKMVRENGDDDDDNDPNSATAIAAASTTALSAVGWTDHAYRPSKGSSSGLVRVPMNSRTSRICPAFARGIHCADPASCKLRHDIPKEFAMPLCHYFQKKGMCFRTDDCPFRHVKVSASAQACPSFALLGFCQDPDCPMVHTDDRTQKSPNQWHP
jgi:hypothetical protein